MSDNSISLIKSAPEYYQQLFYDLANAQNSVRIQMYCIESGGVGDQFKDILIKLTGKGVVVELMYDSIGSLRTSHAFFDEIENSGALVKEYHAINPIRASRRYSIKRLFRRNHRKLVIIDSSVYYLGGMNIGDKFLDWEDIMVRGQGRAVDEMIRAFENVWAQKRSKIRLKRRDNHDREVEVCDCRPRIDHYPAKRLYIKAIKKAKARVWIAQAYFLPRRRIVRALKRAALRGVDVRIIVPDVSDVRPVDIAGWIVTGRLMKSGVKVYRYTKGMMHTKMAIIDDGWMTVGTANLDSMSFYWNLELNLAIRNKETVAQAAHIFNDYQRNSRLIEPDELKRRPLPLRILGRALYYWSWIL